MRGEFRDTEQDQLERSLKNFRAIRLFPRPSRGWIRAIRESSGVSAGKLGRILGVSRQLPLQFEKAEADDTITLKSLRNVANALDCDLVYALVPRGKAWQERDEKGDQTHKIGRSASRSKVKKRQAEEKVDEAAETATPGPEPEQWDVYFCD